MKLTEENKRKIDNYFDNMDVEEVMKKYPEFFEEESFEVGKYYSYINTAHNVGLYVKCTKISSEGGILGYGIEKDEEDYAFNNDNITWFYKGQPDIEEITKEEFLEQIKKYAVETLGFREGVKFKNMDTDFVQTIESEAHRIGSKVNENEWISCGSTLKSQWGCKGSASNAYIFRDGDFAEIIEEPKEITTTDWKPTMELRYKAFYGERDFEGEPVITNKWLEQKWIEQNTGAEEWREIETV